MDVWMDENPRERKERLWKKRKGKSIKNPHWKAYPLRQSMAIPNTTEKGEQRKMSMCDNKRDCPCTYDCPRHGKCCACVAHHRDHNEGVPGCFFSKEAEATYDRSIEALARDRGIIQ